MATRSLIGIEKDNGVVEAIYCHFDGYPAGVGKTLYEHYNNPERIKQLLRLGDLSTLGEFLSEEEKGDRKGDVCFVYCRDMGEPYTYPVMADSKEELRDNGFNLKGADYFYVFSNGEWLVSDCYKKEPFNKLSDVLKNIMEKECDTIALLPGWEKSKGAKIELHHALKNGMKVILLSQKDLDDQKID